MSAARAAAEIRPLAGAADTAAAAAIAAACHGRLRVTAPFLPARAADDYVGKVRWLAENGVALGLWRGGRLAAFMGGLLVDDFRNAGPGCYAPEWAHGAGDPASSFDDYRALYREIAPRWIEGGARIHALSLFASEAPAGEALSLTGFGRIVLDAAAPTTEVAQRSGARGPVRGASVRRAVEGDAEALAVMNARLAEHVGASPVFFPDPRGAGADHWRAWLAESDAVAFVAEDASGPVGYVKAQDPQSDVSDAVHDPSCLAINGMYCHPAVRGRGIGAALVSALADHAAAAGKTLMSVDCETHNPEAFAFWTRLFAPVTWSFERRL